MRLIGCLLVDRFIIALHVVIHAVSQFNEIAKLRRHDGANDQLHHGSVALHVGVDRDVHATHLLFVLGRVALVGLAILLGHSPETSDPCAW